MSEGTWTIRPCPHRQASGLARSLGLNEITASVLVRRGYGDPEEARAFLAGELPLHDPFALGNMREAVDAIHAAIAAGKRICVHGDYDVDGICATVLALFVLRELGADVEWHLPSRFDEGYGVSGQTLERLAEEGCGLVLTVDCGITAVEEVRRARELGLDVVVTDHHRPGEELPDCPVVATRPSDYPFPELCGTGVVYKLGQALLGADSEALRRHLDLVALATIADVVPLVGENRSLTISGLRALARTQKPGLQALMKVAHVDPAVVDAGQVAFRLAPRINAAGRLGHPRAALELLLTTERDEARELANRLEELNRDRQAVEDTILRAAIAQVEEWPEAKRRRSAYVVVGRGLARGRHRHRGVAPRRALQPPRRPHRRRRRASGRGQAARSPRSTCTVLSAPARSSSSASAVTAPPPASRSCRSGSSRSPTRSPQQAEGRLGPEDLTPTTVVDAVLPRDARLTLDLCQELRRLAPFGLGNPDVTLLAPGCELGDLATVGDGKHLRFRVHRDGHDAGGAIAFGQGTKLDRYRRQGRYDVAFRLQENHWNGTVAPQLVVRRVFDADDRFDELYDWLRAQWLASARDAQAARIFEELEVEAGGPKRHPLESETFRALLAEPALLRAA